MKHLDLLEGNRACGHTRRPASLLVGRSKTYKRSRVKALIIAVAVMTAVDILLTAIGLRHAYLAELNPLMLYIFQSGPVIYLLPLALLLCFAILYHYSEAVRWLGGVMIVLAALKALILVQHAIILLQLFTL